MVRLAPRQIASVARAVTPMPAFFSEGGPAYAVRGGDCRAVGGRAPRAASLTASKLPNASRPGDPLRRPGCPPPQFVGVLGDVGAQLLAHDILERSRRFHIETSSASCSAQMRWRRRAVRAGGLLAQPSTALGGDRVVAGPSPFLPVPIRPQSAADARAGKRAGQSEPCGTSRASPEIAELEKDAIAVQRPEGDRLEDQ